MSRKPRRPTVQVSPQFAGSGLAAALGKGTAGIAEAPEPADQSSDWVLFGVDTVAQLAAENAARGAGQTVGQWLSDLIAESSDDNG